MTDAPQRGRLPPRRRSRSTSSGRSTASRSAAAATSRSSRPARTSGSSARCGSSTTSTGMEPGVWYYDPSTTAGSCTAAATYRFETQYLCLEQPSAATRRPSASCSPTSSRSWTARGPDTYRLAHLEAGIVGQRMFLAAARAGRRLHRHRPVLRRRDASRSSNPSRPGWEVIYSVVARRADDPRPAAADRRARGRPPRLSERRRDAAQRADTLEPRRPSV